MIDPGTRRCPEGATLRGRTSRLFAAAVCLGIIATAGACGGDSDPKTSEPSVATSAATQEVTGDLEGYETFISIGLDYSIAYPESWTAQEADDRAVVRADIFAPNELQGDFTPNVNVLCEPIPDGTSTSDYFDANLSTLEARGIDIQVIDDELDVAGTEGVLIHWSPGSQVESSQVLATEGDCGWVLTLSTAEGRLDEYESIFLTMVASFEPH